jgi:hypothetical protein
MKASFQLRIRTPRLELTYLEGRGLLEQAFDHGLDRNLESLLNEKMKLLGKEKNRLATAYAAALAAGRDALKSPQRAHEYFEGLAQIFSERKMPLHVAAAYVRKGQSLGGDEGAQLVRTHLAALQNMGVEEPSAFSNLLVPRVHLGDVA